MKTKTPKPTTAKAKTPAKAEAPVKAKATAKTKTPAKVKTAAKTKAPAKAKAPAEVKAAAAPVKKTVRKAVSSVPKKNSATFTYRAEKGCSVFLAGSFNNWNATAEKMHDLNDIGVYTAVLELAPGSYEYKFVIDGTWCADPECADWVQNSHGTLNSVKHVSA